MSLDEFPDMDAEEVRREHPSGWMNLVKKDSIPKIVDALLDSQPGREFNKSELARQAGVSRQTVSKRIDKLCDLEIVEEVNSRSQPRYRLRLQSVVARKIRELNSAVNATLMNEEWSGEEGLMDFRMRADDDTHLHDEIKEIEREVPDLFE